MYRFLNPMMNKLLNSPVHGILSKRIMTVAYRGIKSNKKYSTPVSYYRDDNTVYCFTNGVWWRNFVNGAEVVVRMQGKDYHGYGRAETSDREEQVNIMKCYFMAVPSDMKFYGVRRDANGEPNDAQVARAATVVVMIKILLN